MNTELELKLAEILKIAEIVKSTKELDEVSGGALEKYLLKSVTLKAKSVTIDDLETLEKLLYDHNIELVVLALENYHDIGTVKDQLDDYYQGDYEDLKSWAYELFCEMYDPEKKIPENYLDLDFYLKELQYDFVVLEGSDTNYIFRNG